jgi:hypothetical protein
MSATTTQTLKSQSVNDANQIVIPTKIEIGIIPIAISSLIIFASVCVAWGKLNTLVREIKDTLKDEIKPDLKDVRERFFTIEEKVNTLWRDKFAPANSPRQLNSMGKNILIGSGIKEIIDEKKSQLSDLIKAKKITNAYDAEEAVLSIVMDLPKHCPDMVEKLKGGAFLVGADVGAVLFVGGIYLRNEIFPTLGFSLGDLDKPKNNLAI